MPEFSTPEEKYNFLVQKCQEYEKHLKLEMEKEYAKIPKTYKGDQKPDLDRLRKKYTSGMNTIITGIDYKKKVFLKEAYPNLYSAMEKIELLEKWQSWLDKKKSPQPQDAINQFSAAVKKSAETIKQHRNPGIIKMLFDFLNYISFRIIPQKKSVGHQFLDELEPIITPVTKPKLR